MAKFNGRDIMLIGCLLGGGTSSSDIQMYATAVDSDGDECPDTLQPDDVYFTIPAATVEGQREPQVGDYLIYDCLVANASGYNQILCEITRLDERGEPYRHGVYMRAICFMAAASGGGSSENKLALVVGTQSADNPYDITASDLEGVTELIDYVFYARTGLRSIVIPDSVTKIGARAFTACSSLTSINIPDGVQSLGAYVLTNCSSLTSVTIPNSVVSIKDVALQCGSSTNKCTFTFEGTTPPTITTSTFSTSTTNKIIVPVGCGETYKTATNWSKFASYIEEATE